MPSSDGLQEANKQFYKHLEAGYFSALGFYPATIELLKSLLGFGNVQQTVSQFEAGENIFIGVNGQNKILVACPDEDILQVISEKVATDENLSLEILENGNLLLSFIGSTSLVPGDLNAATNKLEKINGRDFEVPATPTTYGENFDGSDVDISKFDVVTYGRPVTTSQVAGKLHIVGDSQGIGGSAGGLFGRDDLDLTNRFVQVKLSLRTGNKPGVLFGLFKPTGNQANDLTLQNNSVKFVFQGGTINGNGQFNAVYPMYRGDFATTGANLGNISNGTILRIENIPNGDIRWRISNDDGATWQTVHTVTNQYRINIGLTDLTGFRVMLCGGGEDSQAGVTVTEFENLTSDIVLEDTLTEKSSMVWSVSLNKFVPITLRDLKIALNAVTLD